MIAISKAEDFHATVAAATEKRLVACFSAPWCGGCKLVAPKVAALAEELEASATFATVSAEELETLCEEVEVDSFPHFRVYKEGKILGDYTSSKFDKVDAFIRGLVAPDTLQKTEEETPEGDAAQDTTTEEAAMEKEDVVAEGEEGSKKRQEREEMESDDGHVAKKVKTEEVATEETDQAVEVAEEAEKAEEVAEKTETVADDAEEAETTEVTAEVAEKELEESAPVDKLEAIEAVEAGTAPADAAAA